MRANNIHTIGRIRYIRCFFIIIAFHWPFSCIALYNSRSSSFVLKLHNIFIYDMVYEINLFILYIRIKNLILMSNVLDILSIKVYIFYKKTSGWIQPLVFFFFFLCNFSLCIYIFSCQYYHYNVSNRKDCNKYSIRYCQPHVSTF